jgi:glycosyltransferase involved in cell wall biosynthesis
LKSLHINTEAGFRGGEVQTLGLVRQLAAWGHPAILVAPPGSELARRASDAGLPTHPIRVRGEWDLLAVWRLMRLVRREDPDVLHAHTPHALALALMARGTSSRPLVVGTRRVSFPLRSGLSSLKWASADALVAVSQSIAESLEKSGIPPGRIRVIHSGVDTGRFDTLPSKEIARRRWALPNGSPVVGVVSALSHHKGVGVFMTAFRRVWMEVPEVRAMVAGAGGLLEPLRKAAENLTLPVRFLGFLPDPVELLPALDLLVLPSLSGEGSPGAVKEAAAAGVPVVATEVGGTSEILRPDIEAIFVPPGDPEALALAILRVLKDAGLARSLRRAALERVKGFSMESTAAANLALYRELLNGKAGSR